MKVFDKAGHLKTLPGAIGPTGATGATGAAGAAGATGPAGSLSVTPIRVDASDPVTVGLGDCILVCTNATTVNVPASAGLPTGFLVWLFFGVNQRGVFVQSPDLGVLYSLNTCPSADANKPSTLVLVWDGSAWQVILWVELTSV
jgi:hypothetical protein